MICSLSERIRRNLKNILVFTRCRNIYDIFINYYPANVYYVHIKPRRNESTEQAPSPLYSTATRRRSRPPRHSAEEIIPEEFLLFAFPPRRRLHRVLCSPIYSIFSCGTITRIIVFKSKIIIIIIIYG